jgi:hypothetical protein
MADAERITFVTKSTRGVGTAFDCLTRVGPFTLNDHMTVIEWDAGRSIGIEHRGIVTGAGRFIITKRRHGRTRFCCTSGCGFPGGWVVSSANASRSPCSANSGAAIWNG